MKAQINVITLAVDDLERALAFYREGLGLESPGIVATEFAEDDTNAAGAIAMFRLHGGLILAATHWTWKGLIPELLIAGWPGNVATRDECLEAARGESAGPQGRDRLESSLAQFVLLSGFPGDDSVAAYCANELRSQQYPFLQLNLTAWRLLAQNFRGHRLLIDALDSWLVQQEFRVPEIALAALASSSPLARGRLLEELTQSNWPHWAAGSLVAGWGADTEVMDRLGDICDGPARRAAAVASVIPEIERDEDVARARLRALAVDPSSERIDFVVDALASLKLGTEADVVEAVLNRVDDEPFWRDSRRRSLIRSFPVDKGVRAMALSLMNQHDAPLDTIALVYGNDADFRTRLLESLAPLPKMLRAPLVSRARTTAIPDVGWFLESWDQESDGDLKAAMLMGWCNALASDDVPAAIAVLEPILREAGGFDYTERRQAAAAGLLAVDEVVPVVDALREGLLEHSEVAEPLGAGLVDKWPILLREAGPSLEKLGGRRRGVLTAIAASGVSHRTCPEFPEFVDLELGLRNDPFVMRALLSFPGARSSTLAQLIVAARAMTQDVSQPIAAGEMLARNFAKNEGVLEALTTGLASAPWPPGVLVALALGWLESQAFIRVEGSPREFDPYAFAMPVIEAFTSPSDRVVELTKRLLNLPPGPRYDGADAHFLYALVERLRSDEPLASSLESLLDDDQPGYWVALPQILGRAGRLSEAVRVRMEGLLDQELERRLGVRFVWDAVRIRMISVLTAVRGIVDVT